MDLTDYFVPFTEEKHPQTNCAHCRPGVPCDPFSGACMESKCTVYTLNKSNAKYL